MFTAAPLQAQGQGKGNDKKDDHGAKQHGSDKKDKQEKDRKNDKVHAQKADHDKGKGKDKSSSHEWKKEEHNKSYSQSAKGKFDSRNMRPVLRAYTTSKFQPERVAAGAVARAYARGLDDDDFKIVRLNDRVRVTNRDNVLLIDIDEDRARNLGRWDVRPVAYTDKPDGPAFCRSGEGHPVWGRQWCIEKGFGIGNYRDMRWGQTNRLDNVVFQNVSTGNVLRDALVGVLGNVVFDRLALHAVTLGYSEPLAGAWIGEPSGPRVLRLTSGGQPVAELVDTNRDNRAEVLVVALRPW